MAFSSFTMIRRLIPSLRTGSKIESVIVSDFRGLAASSGSVVLVSISVSGLIISKSHEYEEPGSSVESICRPLVFCSTSPLFPRFEQSIELADLLHHALSISGPKKANRYAGVDAPGAKFEGHGHETERANHGPFRYVVIRHN